MVRYTRTVVHVPGYRFARGWFLCVCSSRSIRLLPVCGPTHITHTPLRWFGYAVLLRYLVYRALPALIPHAILRFTCPVGLVRTVARGYHTHTHLYYYAPGSRTRCTFCTVYTRLPGSRWIAVAGCRLYLQLIRSVTRYAYSYVCRCHGYGLRVTDALFGCSCCRVGAGSRLLPAHWFGFGYGWITLPFTVGLHIGYRKVTGCCIHTRLQTRYALQFALYLYVCALHLILLVYTRVPGYTLVHTALNRARCRTVGLQTHICSGLPLILFVASARERLPHTVDYVALPD